jgi:hypothetical protein
MPITIPTPQTITTVQPVTFTVPAEVAQPMLAQLESGLTAAGATLPTIPAGNVLGGLQIYLRPDGSAVVTANYRTAP